MNVPPASSPASALIPRRGTASPSWSASNGPSRTPSGGYAGSSWPALVKRVSRQSPGVTPVSLAWPVADNTHAPPSSAGANDAE